MDDNKDTQWRNREAVSEDGVNTASHHDLSAFEEREACMRRATYLYQLSEFDALPEYMRHNEYILSYYRVNFSVKNALLSLFRMHNETLNIWTHLAGFVFFFGFTVHAAITLPKVDFSACLPWCLNENNISRHGFVHWKQSVTYRTETAAPFWKPTTRWPFFVFMGGSMVCLLASSTCHLLNCCSRELAILVARLDYTGIAVMIAASFFPPIYYLFQCTPFWQAIYLGMITMMALTATGSLWTETCQIAKYRNFRAMLFIFMGLSGFVPAIHFIVRHWHEPFWSVAAVDESLMALFYVVGSFFYVSRFPERWKPGFFDLVGNSHNIFHVLVIAGAYTHYRAALILLGRRDVAECH